MSLSVIESGRLPRLNTPSYSIIKGTDIANENLLLGIRETILYEAPSWDFKAENNTFVSIMIFIWYYISYQYLAVKDLFYAERLVSRGAALFAAIPCKPMLYCHSNSFK